VVSQPGPQIRVSSDDHSLILDRILIRQMAMRHLHLLFLEVFYALLGIKTGETFFQILGEAFWQLTSFDLTQSILFCKFIFEFTRIRAAMTPEQAHAAVPATELEKTRVQVRAGQ
jgi:hypothetical protein